MLTPDRRLELIADEAAKEAKAIADLLPACFDAQWTRGRRPTTGLDAGIRGKGGPPADPTGDTVSDEARLRIRHELRAADRTLIKATAFLRGCRSALERALAAWEGD